GCHRFRGGRSDGVCKWINRSIGKTEREGGRKDECTAPKTAEDEERDGCDEKKWCPDFGVTNDRHEQIERRVRPLLVNQMKKFLVHSLRPPRTENRSARRMKQAALVVALLLPGIAAQAQRFPDATELLANVR